MIWNEGVYLNGRFSSLLLEHGEEAIAGLDRNRKEEEGVVEYKRRSKGTSRCGGGSRRRERRRLIEGQSQKRRRPLCLEPCTNAENRPEKRTKIAGCQPPQQFV